MSSIKYDQLGKYELLEIAKIFKSNTSNCIFPLFNKIKPKLISEGNLESQLLLPHYLISTQRSVIILYFYKV